MILSCILNTNFSNTEVIWIAVSILIGLISVYNFSLGNYKSSILLLVISGTILRLLVITLDPFLWTWDEQFHALVAKNLTNNPLKPMLFSEPVIDFNYQNWKENHIWLHKQPFFLWQIALFYKVLGFSEFVLRLPTSLMMSSLIFLIYRIGEISANKSIGWYGAFLYAYSFYFIQFVTGYKFTDHNDSAFIFYVTLSIWSWIEFKKTPEQRFWIALIGLFAGIAILNKWLVGLLIYSGWFASLVFLTKERNLIQIKQILKSLAITLLVALPWQLFILYQYPSESRFEFAYNSSHFFYALEGHSETWYYHFAQLSEQYGGKIVYLLIIPGLLLFLRSIKEKSLRIGVLTIITITYLFFSIAKTKVPMFCAIVSPFIFLSLGAVLDRAFKFIKIIADPASISFTYMLILLILGYNMLNIKDLDQLHSSKYQYWNNLRTNRIIAKHVHSILPNKDYTVFNCPEHYTVMLTFYTGLTAYKIIPSNHQINIVKAKKKKVAIFWDDFLPSNIKKDTSIYKIYLKPIGY